MKNKRARTLFATTPHQYSRSTLGARASRPQRENKTPCQQCCAFIEKTTRKRAENQIITIFAGKSTKPVSL